MLLLAVHVGRGKMLSRRLNALLDEVGAKDPRTARAAIENLRQYDDRTVARCVAKRCHAILETMAAQSQGQPDTLTVNTLEGRLFLRLPFVFVDRGPEAVGLLLALPCRESAAVWKRWTAALKGNAIREASFKGGDCLDLAKRAITLVGMRAVEPLTKALESRDDLTRELAAELLAEMLPNDPPDELIRMALENEQRALPNYMVHHFNFEGNRYALEQGLKALADDDEWVRIRAAQLLGEVGNTDAVPDLVQALEDEDKDVVAAAVRSLGSLGDRRAVAPLMAVLADPLLSDYVAQSAANALSSLGEHLALEPLVDLLNDPNSSPQARTLALSALGGIKDPRSYKAIVRELERTDRGLHIAAAEALGHLGDTQAIEPLTALLDDEDIDVRFAVAYSLARLGDPQGGVALLRMIIPGGENPQDDIWHYLTDNVTAALVEPLADALSHENRDVRQSAARLLGESGDPRAVGSLIEALGDEGDVSRISRVLEEIGDPRACDALWAVVERSLAEGKDLYDEDGGACRAALALGALGDDRAIAPLRQMLTDRNAWLDGQAVEVLGKLKDRGAVTLMKERLETISVGYAGLLWSILPALESIGTAEARALVDAHLADFYVPSPPGEISLLLYHKGLDGIMAEYRTLLDRHTGHDAGLVYMMALERAGSVEMARDLAASNCCGCLKDRVNDWAKRNGHLDELANTTPNR